MLRSSAPLSRIALGTYRMTLDSPENLRAAYLALSRQTDPHLVINTVDTSANYMNGGAERMIGRVLTNPEADTLSRNEMHLATKYGYIQGENMQLLFEGAFKTVPEDEIVKYMPSCYHCIHPEFMRDQLKRSLERLRTDYIDTYFIHNPEYFLMHNIVDMEPGKKIYADIKGLQNQMLERIGRAFEALEEEVEGGRIRSYGISSNSFSKPPEHPHFLPYKPLINLAKRAAGKVRGKPDEHGFSAVQMPGNFLEQEGLKMTAKWALRQGLKVLVNRPLNAFNSDGSFRLATYPEPRHPYAQVRSKILTSLQAVKAPPSSPGSIVQESSPTQALTAFVQYLDSQLPYQTSILSYESLRPQVWAELAAWRDEMGEEWVGQLGEFLEAYEDEVRWRGTRNVEKYMEARGVDLNGRRVEEAAIEFLLEEDGVDCVLLGMTRPEYVESARAVLRSLHD